MKATVVLAALLVGVTVAWFGEPAVTAAGLTMSRGYAGRPLEPAWMVLSGVALIALGGVVRRLTP
ncbi:MAG TPA: hypothetical protein VGI12_07625 [Vicinamibacterales bacterium]|jgi:hypothetical protein